MSRETAYQPTRTCSGCNERDAQAALRRFTLVDGRLTWDRERQLGGRGAYLHDDAKCVAAFSSRKPFLRSLRASVAAVERARFVASSEPIH